MVPIGGIINWSGAVVDIPSNYQLCDGTNGTPMLVDNFVIGAGGILPVGSTGGSFDHDHPPGATHLCPGGGAIAAWTAVNSDLASSLPPYYALAYIQRMT